MNYSANLESLEQHYRDFFAGHEMTVLKWPEGRITEAAPWFRVLQFAPGPRTGLWTYVSVGAYALNCQDGFGLEFVLLSEEPDAGLVEILAMVAYYSHTARFGIGHTVPIGWPWRQGSKCDQLLISLPYPFGPELETVHLAEGHAQVLWLLPITKSESLYRHSNQLESLESLFDASGIEYWKIDREPVI